MNAALAAHCSGRCAWARLARVLFVNSLSKSAISLQAFCCQVIALKKNNLYMKRVRFPQPVGGFSHCLC